MPKQIEKGHVGAMWAAHGGGRTLLAARFKTEHGMNVAQQIDAALS